MRQLRLLLGTGALLAWGVAASANTIHVSETGLDTNDGSASAPVKTLAHALTLSPTTILMESGQYIVANPVTIPVGVTVRGGFMRSGSEWIPDLAPTFLLNTEHFPFATIKLAAVTSADQNPATLEHLTVNGGFVSVEMGAGTLLREVKMGGGVQSAVYAFITPDGLPAARVERCWISGGGRGILLDGSARMDVMETMVHPSGAGNSTNSLGMHVTRNATATIRHSVFQGTKSEGLVIESSNVLVENCVFRDNIGNGLRISTAAPVVRGCFFERNDNGIFVFRGAGATIENCTVVTSRKDGIYLRETQTHLLRNILANNALRGVFEDQIDFGEEDPIPPPVAGVVHQNLFWGNAGGHYFDGDTQTIRNTDEEINTATNATAPSANMVANPSFVGTSTLNYRLAANSPAIDAAMETPEWSTDIDGNPRAVAGANGVLDLGAYEYQGRLIHHFGTEYFDSSFAADPLNPGQVIQIKTNPLWRFDPSSPFGRINAEFLPGRLRLMSPVLSSFGFAYWRTDSIVQPNGTVAVIRTRLSSMTESNRPATRIRINMLPSFDLGHLLLVEAANPFAPPVAGREYEMVFDLGQGGFANMTPEERPFFNTLFNIDLLDTRPRNGRTGIDVEWFDVEFVDRATYQSQFTQLFREWTFEGDAEGWVSEVNEFFAQPTRTYDAGRKALQLGQTQIDPRTFGSWASPLFDMPPGKRYMIVFNVSSSEPKETATSFRVRMSSEDFGYTRELVEEAAANGPAGLEPTPKEYRVYGRVPPEMAPMPSRFFFDIMGAMVPGRTGSIYLHDVRVYTTPD